MFKWDGHLLVLMFTLLGSGERGWKEGVEGVEFCCTLFVKLSVCLAPLPIPRSRQSCPMAFSPGCQSCPMTISSGHVRVVPRLSPQVTSELPHGYLPRSCEGCPMAILRIMFIMVGMFHAWLLDQSIVCRIKVSLVANLENKGGDFLVMKYCFL